MAAIVQGQAYAGEIYRMFKFSSLNTQTDEESLHLASLARHVLQLGSNLTKNSLLWFP